MMRVLAFVFLLSVIPMTASAQMPDCINDYCVKKTYTQSELARGGIKFQDKACADKHGYKFSDDNWEFEIITSASTKEGKNIGQVLSVVDRWKTPKGATIAAIRDNMLKDYGKPLYDSGVREHDAILRYEDGNRGGILKEIRIFASYPESRIVIEQRIEDMKYYVYYTGLPSSC
jgi:hypothetical protein